MVWILLWYLLNFTGTFEGFSNWIFLNNRISLSIISSEYILWSVSHFTVTISLKFSSNMIQESGHNTDTALIIYDLLLEMYQICMLQINAITKQDTYTECTTHTHTYVCV